MLNDPMTHRQRRTLTHEVLIAVILLACSLLLLNFAPSAKAQKPATNAEKTGDPVPRNVLLRIVMAEDKRLWDSYLETLFLDRDASIRARAALAAGRIGDQAAVPTLLSLLEKDDDDAVRAMAAFALGEIESVTAAETLIAELKREKASSELKGRIVEAIGKIAAALPAKEAVRAQSLGTVILDALKSEQTRPRPDRNLILLGLTATLRAKPSGAGAVIKPFLSSTDNRIRADAANVLARSRAKDGNEQLRRLLTTDPDPVVRANAARVLGATEDKESFEQLLDRALRDTDSRVRISAIRALAALKDARAAEAFRPYLAVLSKPNKFSSQGSQNEVLEVVVMLGRVLQGTTNNEGLAWLRHIRQGFNRSAPEVEIAYVRVSPQDYLAEFGVDAVARRKVQETLLLNWNAASSLAQALGEIATMPDPIKTPVAKQAEDLLRAMLDYRNSGLTINTLVAVHSEYAIPDVLRALAAFKPNDLAGVLITHLKESDVIVRATAAELLGELPPNEINARAMIEALVPAFKDELNDAALAILDSLARQKSREANDAIKTALDSRDHLLRHRAVALLNENGAGDYSAKIGVVQTKNSASDYERALSRVDRDVSATVSTTKGTFTIRLLPDEAPLTVDNFVQLAERGYFKGIKVHRVVPNFVVQDGDPRGDGNGGPGYQIRCEINKVPFDRGVVGMALSGKDTGGSQWFVTHSPQPHLDGGYTVFGNVVDGMNVVDNIVRGDVIRSIVITDERQRATKRRREDRRKG